MKSTNGTVCLAAGDKAFVTNENGPATAYIGWSNESSTITNGGLVEGNCVLVRAHGNSQTPTITNGGRMVAEKSLTVHADNGFFNHTGSLQTSGGRVVVVGKKISLEEASLIDASGINGGGAICVGGGWQGMDPEIPNADEVFVARTASIAADATTHGCGGNIVVWANEKTTFLGGISAKGRGKEGNGGKAEVSAHNVLIFDGSACLSSEEGERGELLLDPVSITIQASNPDINGNGSNLDMTNVNQLNNATTTPAGFPNAASIITSGAVGGLLNGGQSMTLAAQNFITVSSSITATGSGNSIFFNAPTINLNQPILSNTSTAVAISGAASTVNVGPSGIIQDGANVAAAGATVNLSSAAYVQEVDIEKNITLNGNGIGNTVIVCPATLLTNTFTAFSATYHPFVMATAASDVRIQNMTIDGNSQPSNFLNYRFLGIGYYNAGGTISNVRVTGVQDSSPGGPTQHGQAIFGAVDDGNPYTIQVLNCTIDNFQKAAISMRGPTLTTIINVHKKYKLTAVSDTGLESSKVKLKIRS